MSPQHCRVFVYFFIFFWGTFKAESATHTNICYWPQECSPKYCVIVGWCKRKERCPAMSRHEVWWERNLQSKIEIRSHSFEKTSLFLWPKPTAKHYGFSPAWPTLSKQVIWSQIYLECRVRSNTHSIKPNMSTTSWSSLFLHRSNLYQKKVKHTKDQRRIPRQR